MNKSAVRSTRRTPAWRGAARLATVLAALAAGPALAEGDAARGEKSFKKCMACHTAGEGQPSRVGPNLHNVFGRVVGSLEGFRYSKPYQAARDTGETWTPEKFLAFIENPRDVYTPSTMVIAIKDEQERKDLLAYLLTESPGFAADGTSKPD